MLRPGWWNDNLRSFVFVFSPVPYVFVRGYVPNLLRIYARHLPCESLLFSEALWYESNQQDPVVFSTIVFVFVTHVAIFSLHPPLVRFINLIKG